MAVGKNTSDLQAKIGYRFRNTELLNNALTHSSYSNECKSRGVAAPCNERLEFLGDAVLQIRISDYLYEEFPELDEGFLTKIRQFLVCEGTLARCARTVDLGEYLHLGKGEEQNNGRRRDSILADAFEAVIAALNVIVGCVMILFAIKNLRKPV